MSKIDFSNLLKIFEKDNTKSVGMVEVKEYVDKFNTYKQALISRNQGWIDYSLNSEDIIRKINNFVAFAEDKYDNVVILGIGGSMLGPKVFIDGGFNKNGKSFYGVDNIDPFVVEQVASKLSDNLDRTIFLVQSKSGTTPETLAAYLYFRDLIEKEELEPKDHFVFVTDPSEEVSYLRKVAKSEGMECFDIPANIGGRYSVITPVGLLTLGLMGGDVEKLLSGFKDVVLSDYLVQGSVFELAVHSYLLDKKGLNQLIVMPYSSRLKTFAEWCVQLISESLGKEFDLQGNVVNSGITPVPAVGATDQHSQMQLFKEGPYNKQILFIEIENPQAIAPIPNKYLELEPKFAYLNNVTFASLLSAEFRGTRESLTESLRVNMTLTLPMVDEYNLGKLFMIMQLYTAYYGELLGVNTFDQPGVERSKILTKDYLLQGK